MDFFFFSEQRTVLIGTGKKEHELFLKFPLVIQSDLTRCDLMDYSTSGASAHGILQTRVLE